MLRVFEAVELTEDMIEKIISNPLKKLELEHTIDVINIRFLLI
jgi:hypothetical protein